MRARVPALLLLSLASCASVQSVVEVTGSPGAPGRGPLPVYYAVAPPFPTHEVGVIDTYGQGNGAHLDELLTDAETRARALGADALVVRGVRTVARYVPRTEYRPCGRGFGMRGAGMFTCPVLVNTLEVDMHLRVAAVRRGEASDVAPPWRSAPSLAPAPWGAPHAP
jgi:hypothetical protein